MPNWTIADIPPQTGRGAVVTGAGGLGYETALALAGAGADVILAGRNPQKATVSVNRVKAAHPEARIRFEVLDLASLASVAAFAERLAAARESLDLLINNAGIMMLPTRQTTADGFELQIGTNYLGHFALTARLLPLLRRAPSPRVVSLSSIAHRRARLDLDDLQSARAYKPWPVYGQSKLAMLIFALELQRRSDAGGWGLISNAAHPGLARTNLIENGLGAGFSSRASAVVTGLLGQSAAAGALPTLYAATSPAALGGAYYGPAGFQEMRGPPGPAKIMPQALDTAAATRLWTLSEQLTHTSFPV